MARPVDRDGGGVMDLSLPTTAPSAGLSPPSADVSRALSPADPILRLVPVGPQQPKPDAVAELLSIVRGLLADERARGQGLDGKTSTLTGFTGATLALVASLARDVLRPGLGAFAGALAQGLFVATVCALTAAAVLGLAGVLRPQPRLDIAAEELRGFGSFPLIAASRMEIQGQMVNTLVDALLHERALNDRKARLTRRTGVALAIGYAGVAGVAFTVAIAA
jgi:hypothetical protein